ncbi:hypothetical protein [Limnohabitans sp. T6-5]|uniref:hypothetical protein n=1 Tax=Limnohabitans sp. T6-5 TaxID=1100724 RepID=UPI0011B277E7|nr:hypothetical protein [Limnohabitans sp. T6-5]
MKKLLVLIDLAGLEHPGPDTEDSGKSHHSHLYRQDGLFEETVQVDERVFSLTCTSIDHHAISLFERHQEMHHLVVYTNKC